MDSTLFKIRILLFVVFSSNFLAIGSLICGAISKDSAMMFATTIFIWIGLLASLAYNAVSSIYKRVLDLEQRMADIVPQQSNGVSSMTEQTPSAE
ncbi:MAG: hypothetical protein K8R46_04515 [Pirellulales bacterium]|nr:hypothetical protein [Pirellulales bacterium]